MIKVTKLFSLFFGSFSKRNTRHVLRVSIELKKQMGNFGRTRKHFGNTRLSVRNFHGYVISIVDMTNMGVMMLDSLHKQRQTT